MTFICKCLGPKRLRAYHLSKYRERNWADDGHIGPNQIFPTFFCKKRRRVLRAPDIADVQKLRGELPPIPMPAAELC